MGITAQQVLIQQPPWMLANGAVTRGELVFGKLGRRAGRYWVWACREHGDNYRELRGLWDCGIKAGTYHTRLSGGGASSGVGWGGTQVYNGVIYWNSDGAETALTLTVPASTERVYILGFGYSGGGTATIAGTGGTIEETSLDFSDSGDFQTSDIKWPDQGIDFWKKIGTGFDAGGTITVTPNGDGNVRVMAFSCMGSTADEPDDGVIDPETLVPITTRTQLSTGPINVKLGAGGTSRWNGRGHLDANSDWTGLAETRVYGDSLTAWNPAADTHVNQPASCYRIVLTGTISVESNDVGTFEEMYVFTPSGLSIVMRMAFNATAASQDLRINATGYGAQWFLGTAINRARMLPNDSVPFAVGSPWDNSVLGSAVANQCVAVGPDLVAMFYGGTNYPGGNTYILKNGDPEGAKIYHYSNPAEIDVADGDVLQCWQTRSLSDRGGVEPRIARRRPVRR